MSLLLLLTAVVPFTVVDLELGERRPVALTNGISVPVQITAVNETRDVAQMAVREARVSAVVDGVKIELRCANYELPRSAGRVQVDCPVTAAYKSNSTEDHWGLRAAARLRLWPAGSPWMTPNAMGYPLKQRWFLTHTQMANEPTYVDHAVATATTIRYQCVCV